MKRNAKGQFIKTAIRPQGRLFCQCGCGQEIKLKPWHKGNRIPNYIQGHRAISGEWTRWFEEHKDDKIYCQCGCGEIIPVKPYHKHHGFPKYLPNHLPKDHPEWDRKRKQLREQHQNPKIIDKIRKSNQKYFLKYRIGISFPCIGKYEERILNNLERCFQYQIERQKPVAGYYLDGYCSALNLAIEIDEKHHKQNIKKDIHRENIIREELKCQFLRISIK